MKRLDHYPHCPGRRELSRVVVLCGCLLLFASCHKDDSAASIAPQGPIPVGFSTSVKDEQTRGDVLNTANLTSLGVFASYTGRSDWAATDAPNYMYNQKIERANNSSPWTYSPLKYWPADNSEKISFFAYAPHNPAGLTASANTADGYPVLSYTVPTAEADQTDLLAAVPLMNQTGSMYPNASAINFSMSHALTKVVIRVKSGDKYAKEVTNLSLKAASSGELHFKNGGFEWKNISESSTYSPKNSTVQLLASDVSKDIATFFMLPTGAVSAKFSLTYTVEINGGFLTKTFENESLPATTSWRPGVSAVYTLNLSEKTVTVTTDYTDSSWEAGANIVNVSYYDAGEMKVGDYYYSDGTISDGGVRKHITYTNSAGEVKGEAYSVDENKSPVGGKTCVGIVFYIGQGEGDDVSKYSNPYMQRIDGYVVALNECDKSVWGPRGEVAGLDKLPSGETAGHFDGYSNTQAVRKLSTFNEYIAFYNAVNYSSTISLSSYSSGWYMPSADQLEKMFPTCDAVNICIGRAGGSPITKSTNSSDRDEATYWSSSHASASMAHTAIFSSHLFGAYKTTSHRVRSILTFQRVTTN